MKALLLTKYGKVQKAISIRDIERPQPSANDVLIKVNSASINPVDYKIAKGELKAIFPLKLPSPMGFDVSGIVAEVGKTVSNFNVGDSVYTRLPLNRRGAFSDFVNVDERFVALKPNVSFEEAASFPLVALTTIQALKARAQAKQGMKILIHAGSGGIGTFAVQYAKNVLGLHVTATTSKKNKDFVLALGADRVIAYDEDNYLKTTEKYDIIFDTLGGIHTLKSFKIVAKKGTVVSIAGPPDKDFAWKLNVNIIHKTLLFLLFTVMHLPVYLIAWFANAKYYRFLTESNGEQLSELGELINQGKIHPVIDKVYSFEKIYDAFEYLMKGRARGKVIINLDNK